MSNELKSKEISIETEYEGITLKGKICYTSKDYTLNLLEPFNAETSKHLMYAVPAVYVTQYSNRKGVKEINLLECSNEKLIELYLQNKDAQN